MASTAKEIVFRAMRIINYIDATEEPEAADYEDALDDYVALHEWMRSEFKINWNYDAVEAKYLPYVAGMLAGELVETLPVSEVAKQRGYNAAVNGKRKIQKLIARKSRATVQMSTV